MEEYITEITDGVLTLVKRRPNISDEATLTANQYFVLMYYVTYHSFMRNYIQYKGDYIYNAQDQVYYIDFFKKDIDHGYYISKHYNKLKSTDKGRIMVVTVNNPTECFDMDE